MVMVIYKRLDTSKRPYSIGYDSLFPIVIAAVDIRVEKTPI